MSWDQIACGFEGEETINFGTRQFGLGQDNVFETSTVAVIESSENDCVVRPYHLSTSYGKTLAITLDTSVIIFYEGIQHLQNVTDLGQSIEAMEWTKDGKFLILGLQGAHLVAIHSLTGVLFKLTSLNKLCGGAEENKKTKLFFSKIITKLNQDRCDIIVISSDCKIVRISCENSLIKEIDDHCCSNDEQTNENITKIINQVQVTLLYSPEASPDNSQMCTLMQEFSGKRKELFKCQVVDNINETCEDIFLLYGDAIQHWVWNENMIFLVNSAPIPEIDINLIVKASMTPNNDIIVCLLEDGSVVHFLKQTLEALVEYHDYNIKHFSFIAKESAYSFMLAVTQDVNTYERSIVCFQYPEMEVYFQLSGISYSYVLHGIDEDTIERLYNYIEFIKSEEDNVYKTVKIKSISECDPRIRLERLLRKGKYQEAEDFCKLFNLPLTEINQSKAKKLTESLSLYNTLTLEEDYDTIFQRFISLLDIIEDLNFIAEVCSLTVLKKLEYNETLLKYTLRRLQAPVPSSSNASFIYATRHKIHYLLLCYKVFMELDTVEHNPHVWSKFSRENFYEYMINYLSKGDVKSCVIIIKNLWSTLKGKLNFDLGQKLLTSLPYNVTDEDLYLWIETYVPLYLGLNTCEDFISAYFEWINQTISDKLCVHKTSKDCHSFLTKCLSIVVKFSSNRILYQSSSSIQLFHHLKYVEKMLDRLIQLEDKHGVTVSLRPHHTLTSSLKTSTADKEGNLALLLDLLWDSSYEGLDPLLQVFIIPYADDNNIKTDDVLIKFIRSSSKNRVGTNGSTWEMKSIKLTGYVRKYSSKLETIVFILKEAFSPWSETMIEFESKLNENNPMAPEQFRLEIIKTKTISVMKSLLNKYISFVDFDNFYFDNEKEICSVIIKMNDFDNVEELYEDLEKLIKLLNNDFDKSYVYSMLIYHSIAHGCSKEILDLVEKHVSPDLVDDVIILLKEQLNSHELFSEYKCTDEVKYKENLKIVFNHILCRTGSQSYFDPSLAALKTKINQINSDIIQYFQVTFDTDITGLKLDTESSMRLLHSCISIMLEAHQQQAQSESSFSKLSLNSNRSNTSSSSSKWNDPNEIIHEVDTLANKLHIEHYVCFVQLVLQTLDYNNYHLILLSLGYLLKTNSRKNLPVENMLDLILIVLTNIDYNNILCRSIYKSLKELFQLLLNSQDSIDQGLAKVYIVTIMFDVLNKDELMQKLPWYNQTLTSDSYKIVFTNEELNQLYSVLVQRLNLINEEEIKEFMDDGAVMEIMKKLPHSYNSILIISKLNSLLFPLGCLDMKLLPQLVSKTLVKAIHSESMSLSSSLALLCYFCHDQALKWIDNVSLKLLRQYEHNLIFLAYAYTRLNKLEPYSASFYHHLKILEWEKKYEKFGIPIRDCFDESKVKAVRDKLLAVPDITVLDISYFCKLFKCDFEKSLLFYLSHVTLHWTLDINSIDNSVLLEKRYEELLAKCKPISHHLPCNVLMDHFFNYIWARVNPYYYEVFLVLLSLLNDADTKLMGCKLELTYNIEFLRKYKRRNRVICNEEKQMWEKYQEVIDQSAIGNELSSHEMLQIAQHRLPFCSLNSSSFKKIIGPELNLDNFKEWFKLNTWHNTPIDKDLLIISIIKNYEGLFKTETSDWDRQLKQSDILSQISECFDCITDVRVASTLWYFVVNNIVPPGADQVQAAQICFNKAIDWQTQNPNSESNKAVKKAEKKYRDIKIMQVLNKVDLAKSEFISLKSQPVELIKALYENTPVSFFTSSGINDATLDIAIEYKNEIGIKGLNDIKKDLLCKWLTSTNSVNDCKQDDLNNINLVQRASYMLRNVDPQQCCNSLMYYLYHEDFPVLMKWRSLNILLTIIPPQEYMTYLKNTPEHLHEEAVNLGFVYKLERAGLVLSFNEYISSSKHDILNKLFSGGMTANKCIIGAEIASHYNIVNADLWNTIIKHLTSFNLKEELEKYLVHETKWSSIIDNDLSANAWKILIKSNQHKSDVTIKGLCPVPGLL